MISDVEFRFISHRMDLLSRFSSLVSVIIKSFCSNFQLYFLSPCLLDSYPVMSLDDRWNAFFDEFDSVWPPMGADTDEEEEEIKEEVEEPETEPPPKRVPPPPPPPPTTLPPPPPPPPPFTKCYNCGGGGGCFNCTAC